MPEENEPINTPELVEEEAPEPVVTPDPPKFPSTKIPSFPRIPTVPGAPPPPVQYRTTVTQEVRPGGNGDEPMAGPQPLPRARNLEQLIDYVGEQCPLGVSVRVWQITPYHELTGEDGRPNVPQGPFADLLAHLREAYGPGSYRIRVEHHGVPVPGVGTKLLTIPSDMGAPNQAPPGYQQQQPSPFGGYGVPQQRSYQPALPYSGMPWNASTADDELRRIRMEREKMAATRELKREEAALHKEEAALAAELAGQSPREDASNAQIEALKAELEELKTKLSEPKEDQTIKLMMAMNENNTKLFAAILEATAKKEPDTSLRDMVSLITDTNKQVMAAAQEKSGEFKDLAMTLLTKKMDAGDDQVKTYLDLMDRGEARAMKMLEFMQPKDDSISVDPESPWSSLGAQVVAKGVNALVEIFRNGAPVIQQLIANKIGKAREQITQEDLSVLAEKLKHVPPLRAPHSAPPPPQPAPVMFAPQEARRSGPLLPRSSQQADPTLTPRPQTTQEANRAGPVQSAPAQEATQPVECPTTPEGSPIQSGTYRACPEGIPIRPEPTQEANLTQPTPTMGQANPAPIAPTPFMDSMELDLREKVDICVEDFMLVDLEAERPDHDWPDYANDKWPKSFKDSFVAVPDHAARMALIKSKTRPELWAKVEALLAKEGSPNSYCFQLALNSLVGLITGLGSTPPAEPVMSDTAKRTGGL